MKIEVFVEHTNILSTQSRNLHFAVSWRKEDGFCSLLSLPEKKQGKKCECWVAQFSISANILSCLNKMYALGFNEAYFICKVRFRRIHVQRNPFSPRPVTDAAQLPLKYFLKRWQISLLCEPYNKIFTYPKATRHIPHPLKWRRERTPGIDHKWNRVMVPKGTGNGSKWFQRGFQMVPNGSKGGSKTPRLGGEAGNATTSS